MPALPGGIYTRRYDSGRAVGVKALSLWFAIHLAGEHEICLYGKKLKARKILENAKESHTPDARFGQRWLELRHSGGYVIWHDL